MQARQETQNPGKEAPQVTYYTVCAPLFIEKNLDIHFIFQQAQAWLSRKNYVSLYTSKDQAMLAASQFSSHETPSQFHEQQETHVLAKPVLCIPMESAISLPKQHVEVFFIENRQHKQHAYMIYPRLLQDCPPSNWTIVFNEQELSCPDDLICENRIANN